MSLLNRPSDGTSTVLAIIYKLLAEEGSMSRERIIGLCSPPATKIPGRGEWEDSSQARATESSMTAKTLNRWLELGLFEQLGGGNITISKSIPKAEQGVDRLPRLARKLVLSENNNPDLWSNEGARAGDFTRALAWLLAQDVYATNLVGWSSAEELLNKQVPLNVRTDRDAGLIQNDTRWSGLKAWSIWLGFAWSGLYPRGVLTIDPTSAVRDSLEVIYGPKKRTLPASELVAELAETIPVLDGGTFRRHVEEKLREHAGVDQWLPLPERQLSTSLSRALLRLHAEGTISLELKADAPDRVSLTGRHRAVHSTITHVTLKAKVLPL